MPRQRVLWLFPLLLSVTTAYADKAEEARLAARTGMWQFAHFVHAATTEASFTGIAGTDPSECDALVKKGNDNGLKPTDTFDTDESPMLWRRAPDVCAEYVKVHALAKVIASLVKPWESISAFASRGEPR